MSTLVSQRQSSKPVPFLRPPKASEASPSRPSHRTIARAPREPPRAAVPAHARHHASSKTSRSRMRQIRTPSVRPTRATARRARNCAGRPASAPEPRPLPSLHHDRSPNLPDRLCCFCQAHSREIFQLLKILWWWRSGRCSPKKGNSQAVGEASREPSLRLPQLQSSADRRKECKTRDQKRNWEK